MTSISFIIPTIGRPSLEATIASIEAERGDEVLVIQRPIPTGHWGNAERQEGLDRAKGNYVAFIDDDDVYVIGHRRMMARAIESNRGWPLLFKIQYPDGRTLWQPSNMAGRPPRLKNGNVSSQMICFPNDKRMLAKWDEQHSYADFWFIARSGWAHRSNFAWIDEVLVLMGHNTSEGHGTRNINAPEAFACAR